MKLRIESSGVGSVSQLFLDDVDVSKYIQRIELVVEAGHLVTATLHMIPETTLAEVESIVLKEVLSGG